MLGPLLRLQDELGPGEVGSLGREGLVGASALYVNHLGLLETPISRPLTWFHALAW